MDQNGFISLTNADWQLNEAVLKQIETKEFDSVVTSLYESDQQKADLSINSLSLHIINRTLHIEGVSHTITAELFVLLAAISSGIDVHFESKPDLGAFKFIEEVEEYAIITEKVFPPINWIVPSTEKDYAETLLRRQMGLSAKVKEMNALRDALHDYFETISVASSKNEATRDIRPCTPQAFTRKVRSFVSSLKTKKKIQIQKNNDADGFGENPSDPCIAVKLANIESNGEIVLEEEGMKLLRDLKMPLFAMSVIGPARSGKSSLLSFLYGKDHAFKVSPLVKPETRGFWIAVKEFIFSDKTKGGLLLIDTEGLYDPANGPEMAKAIARFSFMLSNLVVFNSNKVYDQNDLKVLSEGCSYLVSKQATFPYIKVVVRNCSLEDKPLMISQIPSIQSRHQKALREVNKNNDQICTALFPPPTTEPGNVKLEESSSIFRKEFVEFQSQLYKTINEHSLNRRLIPSNVLVAKVQQYVQEVNSTRSRSVDELLDEYEMELKVSDFKERIGSLYYLEFESKANDILSSVINELKSMNPQQSSSKELECRRFYEEYRTVVLKKIDEEMTRSMGYVERSKLSADIKQHWKFFELAFSGHSKFVDYKARYENLLKSLELKEENQRLEEETRKKMEQLRIAEEQRRREAEQREALLRKQAEELAERRRIAEEERRQRENWLEIQRRLAEYERQRIEEERQRMMQMTYLFAPSPYYSSYSNDYGTSNIYGEASPTKRMYRCSNCRQPGHNILTCPYR